MKRTISVAALILLLTPITQGSADQRPRVNNASFVTLASCDNSPPYKPAKRCRYDGGQKFRGTFLFGSTVGKMKIKACFRVYGRAPLGGGHACAKAGPLALKVYPFRIVGVRQPFRVKFTWFVKKPGSDNPFKKAGSSSLKVRP